MKTMLVFMTTIFLSSALMRGSEPAPGFTIAAELDAIIASSTDLDETHIERLKQFDRAQVAAEIKARLHPTPQPSIRDLERDRAIRHRQLRPTQGDMERFAYRSKRVNLYRTLATLHQSDPGHGGWLTEDVVETLHSGATQEEEYVRGHVIDTFLLFRLDMPEPFLDAIIQSLMLENYPVVGGSLGILALTPRQAMLPKEHFWGFVFNPDQARPALWADALSQTAWVSDPEETIFLTLRLNATDCLIRHCDLAEVVAAWQQATDPLGKRALALSVFRELRLPDAAFHAATPEMQREAIRLASEGLDGIPASWVEQTGFLITIATAFQQGTVDDETVRADLRDFLLQFKAQPEYAQFGESIQRILDQ